MVGPFQVSIVVKDPTPRTRDNEMKAVTFFVVYIRTTVGPMKLPARWVRPLGRVPTRVRIAVVAALVVLGGAAALVVSGSSQPDDDAAAPRASASPASSPVTVILPGRPGESPSAVPVEEVKAPDGSAYNTLDAWFVRMMIPHHTQAVEMAALAPGRARNPQVQALAGRIRAAQVPEIAALRAWLQARGLDEKADGHDHTTMRGMQSPDAMRALAAAQGDAFDRMFVTMMTAHHQGAIDMAGDVLKVGRDAQVEEMANGIAAEQAAEITRMREALAG
jgi:uncharacterized protein (DUF305 family)